MKIDGGGDDDGDDDNGNSNKIMKMMARLNDSSGDSDDLDYKNLHDQW